MGGEHFDYKEYWIKEIAESVEEALDIHERKPKDVYDYLEDADEKAVKEIEEGAKLLRRAYSFAYNICRYLSADSSYERAIEDYHKECEDIESGNYKKGRYYCENNE